MTPYPLALAAHPTLRQSLLGQFDDCALQAHLSLEHERGWSDHLQAMGTIWHRFAASALREMARQGEGRIEVDVALAIMSETLRQADVPLDEVVSIPMKHVKDLRWMTMKWARESQFDIGNLVDVEQRLKAVVRYPDPAGGFVVREITGQLDALLIETEQRPADHAIVPDWKSGWGMPPQKDVSDEGYFQQRIYGLLVLRNYPSVQRVTLREFYVRFGQVREAHLYRDRLPEVEEEVAALAERFDRVSNAYYASRQPPEEREGLEADPAAFRPAPGKHCSFCPAPMDCPIYPKARKAGAIESQEMAELIAAELIVAQSVVKQHQDALKAWTGVRGPTKLRAAKDPNRRWGPQEAKKVERPTKEKLEEAIAQGIDPTTLYREQVYVKYGQHTAVVKAAPSPEVAAADAALESALQESIDRMAGPAEEAA